MKIEFVPYHPNHLIGLVLREDMSGIQASLEQQAYRDMLSGEFSVTFLVNDEVIGCGGIYKLGDLGIAWTLPGKNVPSRVWALAREKVLSKISEAERSGLRVVVQLRLDIPETIEWAEKLGFRIYSVENNSAWACRDVHHLRAA